MIRYPRATAPLDGELYCRLVDQLFGALGALYAAVAGSLVMASVGLFLDGRPRFFICLLALAFASIARIAVLIHYRQSTRDKSDPAVMRQWEWTYAIPAIVWMSVIGIDAYLSMDTPNLVLRIFASVIVFGVASGIAGRNASRPWIVVAQVVAVLVPYAVALLQIGGLPYACLCAMTVFMFFGVRSSTQTFYGLLLSAMTTAQRNTLLALRLDAALNNMSHGLVMFGEDRKVDVVNDRFCELMGVAPGIIVAGSTLREVVLASCMHREALTHNPEHYVALFEARLDATGRDALQIKTALGQWFEFRFNRAKMGGTVILVEDVTDTKFAAAKIERMAHYDDLTGMPNRAMIKEVLATEIANAAVDGSATFAMLYLDLDNFKQVNDTLGHSIGDKLLSLVSSRIQATVRNGDICARMAGDEFVIIQYSAADDECAWIADRLIEKVSAPYSVDGKEVIVGLSIGIARAGRDGSTAEDLLKNADLALYRAKQQGKGTFCFFRESMTVDATERREKEIDLRHAIENDEISVYFQPIVDVSRNRVVSCEALARWFHPTKGVISPGEFIGLAEDSGLIVSLSGIVLRKACREALRIAPEISIAVNLSAVQFREGNVVAQIKEALEVSGLPASRLEVEITESLALSSLPATQLVIEQIRGLGVRVALDDFGTGYSSLAYLHQIPFDKIKVDRSFVRDLQEDGMARSLIGLMTSFVKMQDKTLVVEGVETVEQMTLLRGMGVRQMQGYLFSEPKAIGDLDLASVALRTSGTLQIVA